MSVEMEAVVRHLERLVAFETISLKSNLDLIDYVADYLRNLGITPVITFDRPRQKANLFATIGPGVDGGVVLSGHTDVVPVDGQCWDGDPFRLARRNGRYHGRGSCDMKGFIAAVLAFVPHILGAGMKRPIHIALSYDEEVGCLGVPHLLAELRQMPYRPLICIVGEPTEMKIIAGHKGGCELATTVTGLGCHASDPRKGINAIEMATGLIAWIAEMARELAEVGPHDPEFDPSFTTMNVGRIVGGSTRNTLADQCSFDWEIRTVPGHDAGLLLAAFRQHCETRLLPAMRALSPGASIETELLASYPGLVYERDSEAVDLVRQLTGGNEVGFVAFGTEAGLFQEAGLSTVICGPGSIDQAHTANEFVTAEQLVACCRMLERLGDWASR